VGFERNRAAPQLADFPCNTLELWQLPAGHGDVGPGLGKSDSGGLTDSPAAPGYQRDLSLE
jgi:hypothetical protein